MGRIAQPLLDKVTEDDVVSMEGVLGKYASE